MKDFEELIEREQQKDFENNLVEAIIHVMWFYNLKVEDVLDLSMPEFRILLFEMNKIRVDNAIIQANQIGKLFGGKESSGSKTFG